MTLTRVAFDDIQTSDLLYYDPDLNEVCFQFCQDRAIDCLPSLNNPRKFYRKTETGFCEEEVMPERMVDSHEFIFERSLLERFRANHLLFVFVSKELTGVVHFSDYNRPAVNTYLFGLLSAYERSLRKLLVQCGLKNQDMLDYFRSVAETARKDERREIYRRKLDDYEKHRTRNDKLPVFERFYLKDLIELAGHRKIIVVNDTVNDLRNMVMHAHELVIMHDANRNDYIYDFNSFEKFFKQVETLLQDYRKVNNRVAFSETRGG